MAKYYYLATNAWGHNRALEPGNGWSVIAYTDKAIRDAEIERMPYIDTGRMIPTDAEINEIMGTKDWGICDELHDDVSYPVLPCNI